MTILSADGVVWCLCDTTTHSLCESLLQIQKRILQSNQNIKVLQCAQCPLKWKRLRMLLGENHWQNFMHDHGLIKNKDVGKTRLLIFIPNYRTSEQILHSFTHTTASEQVIIPLYTTLQNLGASEPMNPLIEINGISTVIYSWHKWPICYTRINSNMKVSITEEFKLSPAKSHDLLLILTVLGKKKLERELYYKSNTMQTVALFLYNPGDLYNFKQDITSDCICTSFAESMKKQVNIPKIWENYQLERE